MQLKIPIKTLCLLAFMLFAFTARATNYYLSNAGNDSNSGTDPSSPWQTLSKVNSQFHSFNPGDSILFKRGDTFRGSLVIGGSGSVSQPIVIGAYGIGAKPLILGSKDVSSTSSWISVGSNIWKTSSVASVTGDMGNLIFNNEAYSGVKKTTLDSCKSQGDFFFKTSDSLIYIYSVGNPGTYYTHIEAGGVYSEDILSVSGKKNLVLTNLDIRYSANNGIYIAYSYNVTAEYCDVSWIGGMYYNGGPVRMGNAIQIWEGNYNITVSFNRINQVYDAGISPQGINDNGSFEIYNIYMRNNLISNCEYSFEFFEMGSASVHNIFFENNTCVNAGGGWAHNQRSNGPNGAHININQFVALKKDIFIRNNIFYNSTESIIRIGHLSNLNDMILDHNDYYQPSGSLIARLDDGWIGYSTLTAWKTEINQEEHSINSDPAFVSSSDYHLQSSSPAINAGVYVGLSYNGTAPDMGAYETSVNIPPNANAGLNQTITLPTNTITLNGSGTDPEGTISSYSWTKISGPSGETINNANFASATINNLSEGIYQFELKVADSRGATATDTVTITVNKQKNIPPNANAGTDQTIMLPVSSIILTGSATDSNGQITKYLWEKISGPSDFNIENPNSAVTNVTGLTKGIYQFQLTATDDKGGIASSTVQIVVNPPLNIPPIADAGSNQSITLPINTISINGSASDSDGTIPSYLWTKISGPAGGTINNANSASATVNNLSEGVYLFELTVTDDKGAIGKDTVQITVNAAPNIPPATNAGSNQSITLPTNTITLNGSGTDPDGWISSYFWTKISGPSSGIINNSNSASAIINNLLEGVYLFELKVTDNKGAVGKDTVQITVNAAPNIAPITNAGGGQTITLPTNTITLDGNGTDTDGMITSYFWTKISGPSSYNFTNSSSAVTNVSGLIQGVYQFELKATDNKGAVGKDTVQITVNAAANISPTANAGGAQTITLPINTVSLSGNGTDPDGTISSYSWTKICGPSAFSIRNASSSTSEVAGLVEGVYLFELKVTDNKGAVGKDTVQIIVNAAANISPAANASGDQTITLPTNTVSLSGNGTDPDGTISSYSWTKISGPSAFSIKNASSPTSEVAGLVEGVYLFELKVTDNNGATGNDTVKVTVIPATNISPVAQAGFDQTITLPTNTISLNGNGVDSDGTISTYLWTKIAGPAAGTITDASSALTAVKGLMPGNYIFQLTVTDNKGAKGTDSIYVTVNAPKNMAPIANAGGDLTIVLPLNTVYLNGSGKDTDGTITAYHWTQIAGPDSASISNKNSASTVVKNLVGGTYEFELTVTDNDEATGRDTVSVVVALGRISAQQNSINIYPNPVKDIATLEINTAEPTSNLSILISDFAGRIVYNKMVSSIEYHAIEKINMSTFSKGSYAVTVFFDEKFKQVVTIIKQ